MSRLVAGRYRPRTRRPFAGWATVAGIPVGVSFGVLGRAWYVAVVPRIVGLVSR